MRERNEALQARVLALLKRHGWNATSFQVVEPGFSYWFDGEDACVAYVDTGRAWVTAGGPIAPRERLGEVLTRFQARAAEAGRRVCFFAVERRLLEAVPLKAVAIGEQPVWDPRRWEESVRDSRPLREQLRRARAKGVRVREVSAEELGAPDSPVRRGVDGLMAGWLESRRMAPMGFLVQLAPYEQAHERRSFVAERDGQVVAFLSAVPVYAREGWFVQHLLRDRRAPNGSVESLVDALMREAAREGRRYLTLGLAPLAGAVPGWLRLARRLGKPLYDFEGLRAFKGRLRPHAWDRIHLARPETGSGALLSVYDALSAFARGGLLRFGADTLLGRPLLLVWLLAFLLVPWTLLLALPGTTPHFPSRLVQGAWVLFDVGLTVGLFSLVRRWRPGLALLLGCAISTDACVTLLEALLYNVPRARGLGDWLVMGVAVLGPSLAAVLLFWARGHPTLRSG
ncbi:phosphatidylglycerol lysyltransferase domain-containing protein [Melittangium boletus]|uniref:phosphatidylglycerol lysyltransferase domain-containing protein n=1 Tax=Melittangium boletus TaxID=83453 RepID=UPI003DA326BC